MWPDFTMPRTWHANGLFVSLLGLSWDLFVLSVSVCGRRAFSQKPLGAIGPQRKLDLCDVDVPSLDGAVHVPCAHNTAAF